LRTGHEASLTDLSKAVRLPRKYSEDQPRVPAGNPDGGEWTLTEGDTSDGEASLPEISDAVRDDFAKLEQVAEINGFTKHGINQAINRGVSPSAILDAVTNPLRIKERADGSAQYIGSQATVVLRPDGFVITIWGQ
jgi:hypothetical protein